MLLLVMLSWSVFYMEWSELNSQMSLSITTVLAVVTFSFSISDDLPKISYLSLMDIWLLVSFVFVVFAGIECVAVHFLGHRNKLELAKKLDLHARWVVPCC